MSINIKKDFPNRRKPDLSTLVYGKVPPQSPEMEQAVIGACLLEKEAYNNVLAIIHTEEVFYVDAHQKIWKAMGELSNGGYPVDLLTVTEQLRKNAELELIGGGYYLNELSMSVLSSAHVMQHAMYVFEKYILREIIRVNGAMIGDAYEDNTDAFELLEKAEHQLAELSGSVGGDNFENLGSIYRKVVSCTQEQKSRKSELLGVDTGYVELNNVTKGWGAGDFILLAGRPSDGKTALLLNLSSNAVTSNVNAAGQFDIYSIESTKLNLGRRYAAAHTDIPLEAIRTGNITDWQEKILLDKTAEFARLPIRIDDKTQELSQIVASIRKSHRKYLKTASGKAGKLFGVGIDYGQLITVKDAKKEEEQVSTVSKTLKKLALELDIFIIALIQLNREVTKRSSNRPRASDMRYSGQLEQDAQIILLIWHEQTDTGIKTHILVEKNKDGNCADIILKFNGDLQRYINYDDMNQNAPASGVQFRSNIESSINRYNPEDWKDI